MEPKRTFTREQLHYLHLLSKEYPTVQAAGTEIIKLQAILNLPKGTEPSSRSHHPFPTANFSLSSTPCRGG